MRGAARAAVLALGVCAQGGAAGAQEGAGEAGGAVLVHCGALLADPGTGVVRRGVTVVVRGGMIGEVRDGFAAAADVDGAGERVRVIDLSDFFVMPGFIDCHVHLGNEYDTTVRLRAVTESDAAVALKGAVYARRTLEAGFTTVRDMGSRGDAVFALRDAIRAGDAVGPRILAAGEAVSITGGHGDDTNGFRRDVWGAPTPDVGIADGPDECRKAVRAQIKHGADVIKLMATGGVLSVSSAGLAQHFSAEELAAIVEAAHAMGRRVGAHAHGTDGINAALRAGVDSIEHGTYLDEESIRLFKGRGAYYVPTMTAAETVTTHAQTPGYYPRMVAEKALAIGPRVFEAVGRAHRAGVKIAFGTDAGVFPHGENGREFGLMVRAGLTPGEAIRAATVTAAELCGLSGEIGTVEAGKAADLVAVRGDPLADVSVLEVVEFVMRAGVVYKGVGVEERGRAPR